MGLNQAGKQYADKLYLESFDSISKSQREELVRVRQDFAARNMTRSGPFFTAQTQVFLKQVELLTQAWVDSRLVAYKNSGARLDDAAFQEITVEAKRLCEQQGRNAIQNLENQIGQTFGNHAPPNFSKTISNGVSSGVSGISARIARKLSIMQDEAALAEAAQTASQATTQASRSTDDNVTESRGQLEKYPKPHQYYWELCKKLGEECYRTWRRDLLVSVLVAVVVYLITRSDDHLALRNLKVFCISTAIILAVFALWHLVRTPWLVHSHSIGVEEPTGHWWFGVFGVAVIIGILVGGSFSGRYLLSTRAAPVTVSPPSTPAAKSEPHDETLKPQPPPTKSGSTGKSTPRKSASLEGAVTGGPTITTGAISPGPCSNVQIGGSGNQATTNCGPPQRKLGLSEQQRMNLIKDLAEMVPDEDKRGFDGVYVPLGDSEAIAYGDEFRAVFNGANFPFQPFVTQYQGNSLAGISVVVNADEGDIHPKGAREIADILIAHLHANRNSVSRAIPAWYDLPLRGKYMLYIGAAPKPIAAPSR